MRDLEGKVAFVTGATSGIGRATAIRLARAGAKVGALGRDDSDLRSVATEIREAGGEAAMFDVDVTHAEHMRFAIDEVARQWGRLDIVFANAGINGVWAPIDDIEPDEWRKTVDVNLTGTFLTVKYAVKHMKERGGSIIITSSVNGTRIFSNAGATAYSCTKAAQLAMAKMLALELAKHSIRVNVICPGAIDTPIFHKTVQRDLEEAKEPVEYPAGTIPLTRGKPGTVDQVAELVLFLASDRSDHITGTPIWIDGAESLLQG